jgi:hypothetical protein
VCAVLVWLCVLALCAVHVDTPFSSHLSDGDLDLYVVNEDADNVLWRNDMVHGNDFIVVKPVGGTVGSPILNQHGAQVRLFLAGTSTLVALRTVAGGGYNGAQLPYEARFLGLGTATSYDIEVWFPSGGNTVTKIELSSLGSVTPSGLAADRLVVVVRPLFTEVTGTHGYTEVSWGMAVGDFNNDGKCRNEQSSLAIHKYLTLYLPCH